MRQAVGFILSAGKPEVGQVNRASEGGSGREQQGAIVLGKSFWPLFLYTKYPCVHYPSQLKTPDQLTRSIPKVNN
jgi:hypothetical protein